MIALVLSILPGLLWDAGPSTAPELRKAGIREIAVAGDAGAWSGSGVKAIQVDASKLVKLDPVGVDYQPGVAGATSMPWINSNLWRMMRDRQVSYMYEGTARDLPLAMAEAYTAGTRAFFDVKPDSLASFATAYRFLEGVNGPPLRPLVNFRLVDDGSPEIDEVMNLLVRRNLLFEPEKGPARDRGMHVRIGSPEYPKDSAEDPYAFAAIVRSKVGDDNRLVRLYGSETVLARLFGNDTHSRLHLLQYGRRAARGLRVRVLGRYPRVYLSGLGQRCLQVTDVIMDGTATEFTIPELRTFAIVDLDTEAPGTLHSLYAPSDAPLTLDADSEFWRPAPHVSAGADPFGQPVGLGPMLVRSRWTPQSLYLLYICPFERPNLKPDPVADRETPSLWDWDVAEAFIGADRSNAGHYREFEMSPQGEWVDLDIDCNSQAHGMSWDSGFEVRAGIDRTRKVWYGAMKIPLSSLAPDAPKLGRTFLLGLYRTAGPAPDTKYVSWQPTYNHSFHVPASFGTLVLDPPKNP